MKIWSWQHVSVICSVFITELSPVYCCLVFLCVCLLLKVAVTHDVQYGLSTLLAFNKRSFPSPCCHIIVAMGGHPSLATMMLRCSQKKSNLPLCWGAMLEQSNLVGHKNTEDFRSDFKSKICYRYHGLACQNYPKQLPTPSNQHTARNIEQTRRNILYDICLILISCGQCAKMCIWFIIYYML